jgi:hypothetical protein
MLLKSGRFSRRVAIELNDLVWDAVTVHEKRALAWTDPSFHANLLDDFLALDANQNTDELLEFARKYGPLGLCGHGIALGHRALSTHRCYWVGSKVSEVSTTREPVRAWRQYAARAAGIVNVAKMLHEGEIVAEKEWAWLYLGIPNRTGMFSVERQLKSILKGQSLGDFKRLGEFVAREGERLGYLGRLNLAMRKRNTLAQQRQTLADVLSYWLDECDSALCVVWSESGIEKRLGGYGQNHLLMGIGTRLLDAVERHENRYRCDVCGRLHERARRPREGYGVYCGRSDCLLAANRKHQNNFQTKHGRGRQKEGTRR